MSIAHPEKIGLGTWDRDSRGSALGDLGFEWYYTWSDWPLYDAGPSPDPAEFVGMARDERMVGQAALDRILAARADTLLGFNEPDLARQADREVAEALALWGALQATGLRLVSPAASQEQTLGAESWLGRFMDGAAVQGLRVDVVAVHYYSDTGDLAISRPG
ncbi:glycosyl hydrolase [Rhodovulum sp. YEN HP10]|uniref:glycosyl hydrolase n=1 Tax=Rhodovulum sp. HP10 TaxID=3387397 RepID=UPI0039DFC704